MFGKAQVRTAQADWNGVARFVVAAFRADVARAGAGAAEEVARLVGELSRMSHPEVGAVELEFSAFAVDGRPELGMLVYNPVSPHDAERLRALIAASPI